MELSDRSAAPTCRKPKGLRADGDAETPAYRPDEEASRGPGGLRPHAAASLPRPRRVAPDAAQVLPGGTGRGRGEGDGGRRGDAVPESGPRRHGLHDLLAEGAGRLERAHHRP